MCQGGNSNNGLTCRAHVDKAAPVLVLRPAELSTAVMKF